MATRSTKSASDRKVNFVVLICMQNDFIGPKDLTNLKGVNKLHGDMPDVRRILGQSDGPTPIDDVMTVIHDDENTYVIYIEDQHADDPNDVWIQGHFEMFGKHCVLRTPGVLPVGNLAQLQKLRRSTVIPTNALNLVNEPAVVDAILAIIRNEDIQTPEQVRFLFMGGLTDILVADFVRGINHVVGIPNPHKEGVANWRFINPARTNVAVSEKFTFSNFPGDHAAALRSMDKVFINILKDERDIFSYLGINA